MSTVEIQNLFQGVKRSRVRVMIPWFPRFYHNKSLRRIQVVWKDCSYYEKSVLKPNFFDKLVQNHPAPGQKPKIIGFQFWY